MTLCDIIPEIVIDQDIVMGPTKAPFEASVRCLVYEFGAMIIRANAISAGTAETRAACSIAHSDEILNDTMRTAPLHRTVDACEICYAELLLESDHTTAITGEVLHVVAGHHIEGMAFPANQISSGSSA